MKNASGSLQDDLSSKTVAVLAAMLLIDSLHLIFGRMLRDMSPYISGFYVLFFATVEITLFLAIRRQIKWYVLRDNLWFFLAIGASVAIATVFSYASVTVIDAGTASLLGRSSTVITLALSYFWLREKLTGRELLGATLCVIGAIIIGFQPGNIFRLGSLYVMGAVIFYSLHIAIVKKYGDDIDFGNFFLFRVGLTALFLGIFMFGSGNAGLPPTQRDFLVLLVAGTVDVVISRTLYYWALRQMRLGIHTIILTAAPVLTIIWSVLLFDESPTVQGAIGGAIVIAGIIVVALAQQRAQAAE